MTLTEIKSLLARHDTAPSKSLGQNFLFDQNLARWTVDQLEIQPGDHVVEIGPGLGSLTDLLAERATTLTLIEKDDRLIPHLRARYCSPTIHRSPVTNHRSQITLHHTDAVTFDTRQLLGRGPLKIIGNLPYYVSTPILDRFADPLLGPTRLVFTLQRELADRLNARPRTKAYGAMTVSMGRRWRIQSLRNLPPSVFHPAPKVDSSVILITPRPTTELPICDGEIFERLIRSGFSERRKQLHRHLGEYRSRWPAAAAHLGVAETIRAEELSIPQWIELARFLAPAVAQRGDEDFDVVDHNDTVIDTRHRDEVHARDLRHRATHILVFNAAGELLLQKRSPWKDKSPGLWDSSTAGHVDAGETYEQAAHRELQEEIGIEVPTLTPLFKLGCSAETGHEFLQIYRATHEGPFLTCPKELEGAAFFSMSHVEEWLRNTPADFSPVFRLVFPRLVTSARA
ncbi:MAG: 16S rRNA (adenine(1518)-N(6)/adenine(1519)-N(6))-dimethyltransferase RsmA [Chthoniobacterales bacterium]